MNLATLVVSRVQSDGLRDFRKFIKKSFEHLNPATTFIYNWHIDCLSEYLLACYHRKIKRLIINVPPRTTKSTICSQAFPAFILGLDPSLRFMGISHSEDVSLDNSVKTRQLMESEWYKTLFPNTAIRTDQNQKSRFDTMQNGYRMATTTQRGAAGKGANFICPDDYLNTKMAQSDQERETALNDYGTNIVTRLNDKARDVIIIIEQRLHDRDLTGKLIAENQGYTHLCLPAIFEDKKIISFGNFHKEIEAGDLLDKVALSKPVLQGLLFALGSDGFAGQYMQSPVAAGGNIIKLNWFKRYNQDQEREYDTIIVSADTAYKEDQLNDPSALLVFGIIGNDIYLIDVLNKRMEYPELKRQLINLLDKCNPDYTLIEDKASGQSLIQELKATKYAVVAIKPEGNKIVRLHNCAGLVENGKVYLPEKAEWLFDFEQQIIKFPKAAHDDMVDGFSQCLNWFKTRPGDLEFFSVDL